MSRRRRRNGWSVDGLLPAGGISTLAAKPKVGKSTLARDLALSVATGTSFLGRETTQGSVVYLALEEKRSQVRTHFKAMGATGDEPIFIYAATAPADALDQVRALVAEKKPVLLIIDPLFRFTRVRDGNDYTQVTQALEPLVGLAREMGTHILLVHHERKMDGETGDRMLGSTAIFGAVDTAMSMKRTETYRTICSRQRYGEDLEETTLRFDAQTRTTTLGETKEREDMLRMMDAIVAFLETQSTTVKEATIDEEVGGRAKIRKPSLRELVKEERVIRHGKGGKGDAYRYGLPGIPDSERREPESDDADRPAEPDPSDETIHVPWFPPICREPENQNQNFDGSAQKNEPYSGSQEITESAQIPQKTRGVAQSTGNQRTHLDCAHDPEWHFLDDGHPRCGACLEMPIEWIEWLRQRGQQEA